MNPHTATLDWIESQHDRMRQLVIEWAGINSGTYNLAGLATLVSRLVSEFAVLDGDLKLLDVPPERSIDVCGNEIAIPLGRAISIRKRPDAPLRIFLGIHYDTVYGSDHSFQQIDLIDEQTLRGPGVVDAKGGLAIMLTALEGLERSGIADRIGWEVLINPDEEIGSPGSINLLHDAAKRNHFGLVFEPAFPDGSLVSERKGSGNFSIVIRGKSAHAGRAFQAGRNAIVAASDIAISANRLNGTIPEMTLNIGRIDGGGPTNVVPELAVVRLNVRIARTEDQSPLKSELERIAAEVAQRHEVSVKLHGRFLSPPKLLDDRTRVLCQQVETCGTELGIPITWTRSGGVSDGNRLAAAGLPVLDTLGPRGGNLHSPQEYVHLPSLTERARLCALLLLKFASGEFNLNA